MSNINTTDSTTTTTANTRSDDSGSSPSPSEVLANLQKAMDTTTLKILPVHGMNHYMSDAPRKFLKYSVLFKPILEMREKVEKSTSATAGGDSGRAEGIHWPTFIAEIASKGVNGEGVAADALLSSRALGCMMGLALGDSVGAPLEFLPVDSSLPPFKQKMTRSDTGRVSFLDPTKLTEEEGKLIYVEEYNKFHLNRGQWTDDSSMALAMAESMLVHGGLNCADTRIRFYLWWFFGYCNAFRYDKDTNRGSVGLGGNISKSLEDLFRYNNKDHTQVDPFYGAQTNDAGNGAIMRLAPIPIRYHANVATAMEKASDSSYTTHPGPDSANCCRFLSFFCVKAMNRGEEGTMNVKDFVDATIKEFIATEKSLRGEETCNSVSMRNLFDLLNSQPPSPKEQCWDWKADRIQLEETIKARGRTYNGYPVTPGYFGSYCMDALAMALWSLTHSDSLVGCILRIVNLLGDCDSTGAVAGQMAGAFYGYNEGILRSTGLDGAFAKRMLTDIRQWDPNCEIELRALLLLQDGKKTE